jgi:cytidylate kinase
MWNKEAKIAISGKSGSGNTTVTALVSNTLGVNMVNYTFRTLAEDEGMSFEELREAAEKDTKWDLLLDKRQIEMANKEPCVLGSRLAIWLWKEADLKVYLSASVETRSKRVASRENKDWKQTMNATKKRDQQDHDRYLSLYQIDNDFPTPADLVIDVEKKSPEEIAEEIIAFWAEKMDARNLDEDQESTKQDSGDQHPLSQD